MQFGRGRFSGLNEFIEPAEGLLCSQIMTLDYESHANKEARDKERDPTPGLEFDDAERNKDKAGENKSNAVDGEFATPVGYFVTLAPPMPDHAELRERKGDK